MHPAETAETTAVTNADAVDDRIVTSINTDVFVDLNILKVDADGMTTPLSGAGFELHRIEETTEAVSYIGETILPDTNGEEHRTGSDGQAAFNMLPAGYYEVWERYLPAGYVSTGNSKFYIKIESGTVTLLEQADGTAPKDWTQREDEDTLTFDTATNTATLGNVAGAALPNTGGPGTRLTYLIGLTMTAFAGAGLVMRRRRRRRVRV